VHKRLPGAAGLPHFQQLPDCMRFTAHCHCLLAIPSLSAETILVSSEDFP
jgi:hypothetical protein